ncbi:MAG TPA: ATP-binding protein, partial [Xanthobacteraceae bacterium]|nr:ATP-binding protein [Xanthobacteraceae bacterium]
MPKPDREMRAPPWWSNPSANTRYVIAILSVVAGLSVADLLTDVFRTEPIASSLLCAVMFVAWFSGFGPGLLAIALSLLAFHYYATPPFNSLILKPGLLSLQIAELPRLALFSITSLFVNFLMAAQRRTTDALRSSRDTQRNTAKSLRQSRADLEDKVRDLEKLNTALKIGETYLAEAQRLSHTGSFGWNVLSGKIIWSEESYRIYEYDPATSATIDMVLNRTHPDDVVLVREVIERATAHREAFDFEHRLLMPDGSVKHLNVVAHPLIDEPDELHLVGAVMDITARKKSEEALRKSEQRYRHLFHHMPMALWQLNMSKLVELLNGLRAEGVTELRPYAEQHPDLLQQLADSVKIEEVNERMISMLGARDASEILGLEGFRYINPDTFLRALESRWRGEPTHQQEAKIVTLDGRVIDVLMTTTRPGLINDPDVSLMGIIDITERVRAQEMLQRVQADFAHAARMSMLGELTASIAHEVNQPLAAIATNGEVGLRLLNRPGPDLAEMRELTTWIVNDARRAADVIARVRTMAMRQAPEQRLLAVDEVIREALLFLRHEVESRGLMVTHHLDPAVPKVLGDHTQLQQVFVNLTVNAIQAMTQMETTRRTLVIRTTLSDPNTLCCTLEDSGPGIKPEHLDHLFDRFFTTKDAGMGLGLAISRSIIEAHGGCIRADNDSALGGARF